MMFQLQTSNIFSGKKLFIKCLDPVDFTKDVCKVISNVISLISYVDIKKREVLNVCYQRITISFKVIKCLSPYPKIPHLISKFDIQFYIQVLMSVVRCKSSKQ